MLKTLSILEVKLGEKVAQLHLDPTFTYGEVHDALHKMLQFIVERINETAKMAAPQAQAPQGDVADVADVVVEPMTVTQ